MCEFAEKAQLTALFTQETPQVHDGGALETVQNDDGICYLPWRNADFVFENIQPFLDSGVYSLPVIKGLVTSSGGLTESTLKASSKCLFTYLSALKHKQDGVERKARLLSKMEAIFEQHLKDDRVTVPLMKTIEMLLTSDYIPEIELCASLAAVHAFVVKECNKTKNIVKLLASIGVFAGMLTYQNKELAVKALRSLLFLLYHNFPKVRKSAAEKLYTSLLTLEDYSMLVDSEDAYEKALEVLSETDWALPVAVLTDQTKVQFYGFFGQEVKTAAKGKAAEGEEQIKT